MRRCEDLLFSNSDRGKREIEIESKSFFFGTHVIEDDDVVVVVAVDDFSFCELRCSNMFLNSLGD